MYRVSNVNLFSIDQQNKVNKGGLSLEEALNILMGGFLRGGSSFLKGEIIKAGSGVNREVRVGVTHVSDFNLFVNCVFNIKKNIFILIIISGLCCICENYGWNLVGT